MPWRRSARAGFAFVDLTESNPTASGCRIPSTCSRHSPIRAALRYAPEPLGLPAARAAVAATVRVAARRRSGARRALGLDERGVQLAVQAALRPGRRRAGSAAELSAVRAPHAARGMHATWYGLEYHGRWEIDFAALPPRRPNTCNSGRFSEQSDRFVSRRGAEACLTICRERAAGP